jgi:hypothetical protein
VASRSAVVSAGTKPLFLLGAGFNIDANAECGTIDGAAYPLAGDLARICFDRACPPKGKSIEDLFHEAEQCGNSEPMHRLAHCLMNADYQIVPRLLPCFHAEEKCYSRFFQTFADSRFLTFNYDSLPELFLLRYGEWCPRDGYGISIDVETHSTVEDVGTGTSSSPVLHLHGSLCVYASTFIIDRSQGEDVALLKEREAPEFFFDPGGIGPLFHPYLCMLPNQDWIPSRDRVIAPIPDKAEGLKGEFVRTVYGRAAELLRASTLPLLAIGYGFGHHDSGSYGPLLTALQSGSASVLVVSPHAVCIRERISAEFPGIHFEPLKHTLKSWVDAGFPGLQ